MAPVAESGSSPPCIAFVPNFNVSLSLSLSLRLRLIACAKNSNLRINKRAEH